MLTIGLRDAAVGTYKNKVASATSALWTRWLFRGAEHIDSETVNIVENVLSTEGTSYKLRSDECAERHA